ncbi:MAG: hypothetical protein HQK79_17925 [Desulfobacterales bacterium]|nr:hypothetical protein [Desulfobacterales bacterium]
MIIKSITILNDDKLFKLFIEEIGKDEEISYLYISTLDKIPLELRKTEKNSIMSRIINHSEHMLIYEIAKSLYQDQFIVLGLKMTSCNESQHKDFNPAIVMIGILIVLGFGLIFFIFGSSRNFVEIKKLSEL